MTLKPYYQDDYATIYHGDCRSILPQLPSIDLVVTDPPYGIDHVKGAGGKGKHNRRNITPVHGDNAPFNPEPWLAFNEVILWGANHYAQRLPHGQWLIWDKLDGLESFDSFSDIEVAWRNRRNADRIFRHLWKGICQASEKDAGRVHPTQKPIALMGWCINLAESSGTILDPYMGSGPTPIAAKRLGRKCIGIEIEEKYCEIAARRLEREPNPIFFVAQPPPDQHNLFSMINP